MEVPVGLLAVAFVVGILVGWLARGTTGESRPTIIPPRSPAELDARVRALVSAGQKIQAIRLYREFHHVDLKDANDIINAIERAEVLPSG